MVPGRWRAFLYFPAKGCEGGISDILSPTCLKTDFCTILIMAKNVDASVGTIKWIQEQKSVQKSTCDAWGHVLMVGLAMLG